MLSKNELKIFSSLSSRQGRRKSNLCLCDGIKSCLELCKLRPDLIVRIFHSGITPPLELSKFKLEEISETEMQKISPLKNPQGLLIIAKRPEPADFSAFEDNSPFLLILDNINDPGNLGTIIRTASAIGLKKIFLSENSADPFSEKVIRSATARQFALNIIIYDNLQTLCEEIKKAGCENIFLTAVSGGKNFFQIDELFHKSAIIIGNEAHGLPLSQLNGTKISIPMPGETESLNVAQATTIILYEFVRRKFSVNS